MIFKYIGYEVLKVDNIFSGKSCLFQRYVSIHFSICGG